MAEAASIANLRFLKTDRQAVEFYSSPRIFNTVLTQGVRSWRDRSNQWYNRFVQISYPNKLTYLGIYASSIFAIQKYQALPPNLQLPLATKIISPIAQKTINWQNFFFGSLVQNIYNQSCNVFKFVNYLIPDSVSNLILKPFKNVMNVITDYVLDSDTFKRVCLILATWLIGCWINRRLYKYILRVLFYWPFLKKTY